MVKTKKGARIGMAKNTFCAVVKSAADNLDRDLKDFQKAFPGKYTASSGKELRDEAEALSKIPEPKTRRGPVAQTLETLEKKVEEAVSEMRVGANYIRQAFPKDVVETRLAEAGLTPENFRGITDGNWDITTKAFTSFSDFLGEHEALLSAKGFMPTAFPAEFAMIYVEYDDLYEGYRSDIKAFEEETARIADQTNALNDKLSDLLKMGVSIYRNDETKRRDYILSTLQNAAAPKTGGGIRGGCVDDANDRPLKEVKISVKRFDKTAFSAKNGRWLLKPLPEGLYDVTIELEGYETLVIPKVKVRTGVVTTFKDLLRLKKLAVGA